MNIEQLAEELYEELELVYGNGDKCDEIESLLKQYQEYEWSERCK